jgi:hypothetical protein
VLTRAQPARLIALDLSPRSRYFRLIKGHAVELLWDVCQIPITATSPAQNTRIVGRYFASWVRARRIDTTGLPGSSPSRRTDGDIDTISIAYPMSHLDIRGEPFRLAGAGFGNKAPDRGQLSDALQGRLTQRLSIAAPAYLKRLKEES